jgi:hypothetical protein
MFVGLGQEGTPTILSRGGTLSWVVKRTPRSKAQPWSMFPIAVTYRHPEARAVSQRRGDVCRGHDFTGLKIEDGK